MYSNIEEYFAAIKKKNKNVINVVKSRAKNVINTI